MKNLKKIVIYLKGNVWITSVILFCLLLYIGNDLNTIKKNNIKQNEKIYSELINVKLRMNRNALQIQGVKRIIDLTPYRKKNEEESFIFAEEIVNTSSRYNTISASLLTSIIYVESRFDRYAISIDGAMGLGQIMPQTLAWICTEWNMNCTDSTVFDPIFNIRATAWYYDWLYKNANICKGNKEKSIAFFNGGGKQAYRWGLYRKKLDNLKLDSLETYYLNKLSNETKNYVIDVMDKDSLFEKNIKNELFG